MALSILGHYVKSGEFLYSGSPLSYTRTEDLIKNKHRVVVGGFGSGGLHVGYFGDGGRGEDFGLSALRKF
jgi:hypothetical protein